MGPLPPSFSGHLLHSSPLGLVPKAHSCKWMTIVDQSSPSGKVVNDGVDQAVCFLKYAALDNAVDLIKGLGVGT